MKTPFISILLIANLALSLVLVLRSDNAPVQEEDHWSAITEDSSVSYTYRTELVRVIDGDTVVLDIDLGFETWLQNQTIRLYGIDTPEIRGEGKEEGLAVKQWLEERIADRELVLQSIQDKKGKYGRWLGILFADGVNLNAELIETGRAKTF